MSFYKPFFCWIICGVCLLLAHTDISAQSTDSLKTNVSTGVLMSRESEFLPHYLLSHQWGMVKEGEPLFLEGDLTYEGSLGKKLAFSTGFAFRNTRLSEHFIDLGYDQLHLTIGRKKNRIGGLSQTLSSGSMALSRNARPIPMIQLALADYINVPFTGGYFKTKGHLGHGWLEDDRYISNAFLHSKSFYLMLDLTKEIGFTAASGVVHFAQYGGTDPFGEEQPSSFSDYLRVFRGAGIPNPDGTTAGESNGLGNHLGIVETTVTKTIGDHLFTINYQKPFEDEGGLQYVSLTDYLFGVEWQLPGRGKILDKVYIEYIQTKWQSGPGLPDPNEIDNIVTEEDNFGYPFGGRDDLYNNWLYRDGWTYESLVIGNPLFLTYQRTLKFFEPYPDYGVAIANNRLRVVHLGLKGNFSERVAYKGLFTYTSNFGTYSGLFQGRFRWDGAATDNDFDYVFRPAPEQFYSMFELNVKEVFSNKPIDLNIRLAVDTGGLYQVIGGQVMFTYSLSMH